MNWFEYLVNSSLEREYPTVFSALYDRVEDKETWLRTGEKIPRDQQNLDFLNSEITRMMVEKYKIQLSQSLDQTTSIFLIDGNNKNESHIMYDLLKQIISKYHDFIKDNDELVEHLRYLDPEFDPQKPLDGARTNISQLLIREQIELEGHAPIFWEERSKIWIWSNPIDLLAYSKQSLIFDLLWKCIEEAHWKWWISHCYCINPQWLTHHEQKTLARMLERWYLWWFSNSYCYLKVRNIAWWWETYRNFWWNHPIQCPHDYSTHSFTQKDVNDTRSQLI